MDQNTDQSAFFDISSSPSLPESSMDRLLDPTNDFQNRSKTGAIHYVIAGSIPDSAIQQAVLDLKSFIVEDSSRTYSPATFQQVGVILWMCSAPERHPSVTNVVATFLRSLNFQEVSGGGFYMAMREAELRYHRAVHDEQRRVQEQVAIGHLPHIVNLNNQVWYLANNGARCIKPEFAILEGYILGVEEWDSQLRTSNLGYECPFSNCRPPNITKFGLTSHLESHMELDHGFPPRGTSKNRIKTVSIAARQYVVDLNDQSLTWRLVDWLVPPDVPSEVQPDFRVPEGSAQRLAQTRRG